MTRRIALFTHSTNPRGGVVHALELGAALRRRGHEVVLHAPSVGGATFFREPGCDVALVPAAPPPAGVGELVALRRAEFAAWFAAHPPHFDAYHAGDGLGGNALADLARAGAIAGFARTVHHLDAFADPVARAAQRRSVDAAAELLCVSELWRDRLRARYDREATLVPNGVDRARFTPAPGAADAAELARLDLGTRPFVLAVGGLERRKNALGIVEAFALAARDEPALALVVAGGASLLDHGAYPARVRARIAELELTARVRVLGPVADATLAALYRGARALVFPSLVEGFGLAVLEALACGTPPIVSRRPPFTEYLSSGAALFVDPDSPAEIAAAIARTRDAATARAIVATGEAVVARHGWDAAARACERVYARLAPQEAACPR